MSLVVISLGCVLGCILGRLAWRLENYHGWSRASGLLAILVPCVLLYAALLLIF